MSVAPDGSPVELYLRLPPLGEAELVHGLVPAGAEILELGCGVGRVTHELVRERHPPGWKPEAGERPPDRRRRRLGRGSLYLSA